MALLGALCVGVNALGFTNRSLRAQVSRLLGQARTVSRHTHIVGFAWSRGGAFAQVTMIAPWTMCADRARARQRLAPSGSCARQSR
jgi:hypothetical protein